MGKGIFMGFHLAWLVRTTTLNPRHVEVRLKYSVMSIYILSMVMSRYYLIQAVIGNLLEGNGYKRAIKTSSFEGNQEFFHVQFHGRFLIKQLQPLQLK